MSQPFPLDQFRDVFQITTKMKNKLQPFFAEYKNLNMQWIVSSLQEIHKYFFDQNLDPNIKFNTIIGIKFLFDTSEVVLINLLEIYFLPKIFEIASFDAKGDEDKRATGYFVSVGYSKQTAGIQKLSYNFVRLAAQFIQAAAIVKSKKLYYAQEQPQSSDYFDAYMRLQALGWKPYSKLAYYKETVPTISAQYKKNLQNFEGSADNYINYYTQLFKNQIFKGKANQNRIDPKRVLQSGDLYVTANTIDLCAQALHSPSVRQRLNGLILLNEFVRWGDIQAAYQINCTDLLDQILNQIAGNVSGVAVLSRGRTLFNKLQGSEQLKQQFYVQFLKAMQFWSLCYPKALKIKDRDSKIKLAHEQLRMKLKMQFPDDKNLKEHKLLFDRSFQKKKNRNKILLTELEGEDPQYISLVPIKSKPINVQPPPKQGPPKETPKPLTGDYNIVKANINEANQCYNSLTQNEASLPQKIQKLKKFRNQFESKMENAQIDDDQQFDQLFQSGAVVLQKIDKALPHLDKYTANKLSFKDLPTALKSQTNKSRVNNNDSPSKPSLQQKQESPIKKVETIPEKKEVPSPQKKHQIPSQSKIPISSKNIQQKPKLQKPPILQQNISVKIEQKPANKLNDKNSQNSARGQSLKIKQEQKPKIQQIKHKVEEVKPIIGKINDSKKVPQNVQVTPVKMKQQFSSLHSISGTLPEVSKKSLQKSLDQNSIQLRRYDQQISIIPASHSINASQQKQPIQQNLFQQQHSSVKDSIDFTKKQPIHQQQIQLEMSHNKPKNIDNVKGSYKFKPTNTVQLRSPKDILKQSKAQSQKGSRIDFQQSKLSKLQMAAEDDDDLIMMPDDNPLQLSFHDIGGYQQQLKQNKELSFKKVFEAEKYLLGAQKNTKLFWLEKDTMSLIKPSGQRNKSRNKDSSMSIPGILSQKDKKYQDELKYIEDQKNRKIRQLQKKISNLQTQGKQMHQKIVEQDKEILTFKADSSVANSRTKKNFYIEDQDQLFRAKVQKNGRDRQRSFYQDSTKQKQPRCLQPQGKLVHSRKYAQYFTSFADEKRKKNLLKNKELLLKDQSIEFGCMSRREGDNLIITFYITPQYDLQGLTYTINPVANSSLDVSIEPRNIPSIRKRKQQKVFVSVKVKSLPYHLPQIQFVYTLEDRICSQSFTVPCSFHKFIHIETIPDKEFSSKFQSGKNIIRGEEVPYSRKLLKNLQSLSQYFSNGSLIRNGEPNQNGEVEFGGRVQWQRQKFWIRIGIKLNQFICVQAVGEELSTTVQFYICLLTSLVMKNIQFSQIR